ncbi:lipopolysaccharide biosynthesis protein [Aquirufa antheringensis]|uniref:lipopolysaccharide biosynthesis protein n=1 Tax=Aquirufa antheringensis TaxID=2516559 RepID=UPI001032F062|nr:lipopolysaccharide biosynthesis protein [Aquirufa antheringensis]
MSLAKQSFKGVTWTMLDIIFNKAIYFISTLILARLLGPSEFGILGMITIFFTIGTTLVDSGLSISIVRTLSPNKIEYSTIFYLNIVFSTGAYFLMFFIAPYVADFYKQEILTNLIRIYCIGFLINALKMVPQSILIKEMDFKKIAIFNIPGNIIGLVIGVLMALNDYKVWSIVGLFLSSQLISSLVYIFFSKWKPSFYFSIKYVKRHLSFGYKLMLSAQLNTIFENIYNVLIGKYFTIQVLGYYDRAYTLNNYPTSILSLIVSKVSLPLFSNIQEDSLKFKQIYRKIQLFSFFLAAPVMLGALVLAKPLILVLMGNGWIEIVPFFQILCLAYVLFPIHTLNINILNAFGKSNTFLKIEIFKKIITVLFIIIGLQFGIMGLVWSNVFGSIFSLIINTHFCGSLISYKSKNQIFDLIPTLGIAIIMAVTVHLASLYLIKFSSLTQLVSLTILGVTSFIGLSYFTKNESLFTFLDFIKSN